MTIAPKIKHIDQLANGVLRFRRRFPKDVSTSLSLQVSIREAMTPQFAAPASWPAKSAFLRFKAMGRIVRPYHCPAVDTKYQ